MERDPLAYEEALSRAREYYLAGSLTLMGAAALALDWMDKAGEPITTEEMHRITADLECEGV